MWTTDVDETDRWENDGGLSLPRTWSPAGGRLGILDTMARKKDGKSKEPGRLKQMWQVFQMTRRYDKNATLFILLGFLAPVAVGIILAFILAPDNGLSMGLWITSGVLGGVLLALIILGRRAERAAYSQIEGKPGAVGAVMRGSLGRGWISSEMPVAVNGKTQDAVYRAVGRGGVVLIGEGPKSRLERMLGEEKRKIGRILPNVPVVVFSVGPDTDSLPLHKISRSFRKIKKVLTKAEVATVNNRLQSLAGNQLPIPKGVDPFKVRPQRGR